jgi:NAD(P)-dependent dehydrogenase (short-subunit alcohol dehydrogenase family)
MSLVVITGGNRGIGLHLAGLYAEAGDQVVLGIRRPEDAPSLPGTVLPLDVGESGSVASFATALAGRSVDILINNAGVLGPDRQSALEMDFEGFIQTLNVNTLGPLRVTQALLPNLRSAEQAKVVILTSRMGSLSYAKSNRVAYRASKAAANKVTQCLATDLAQEEIAVAAVHPGWVRTDMGGPSADIAPEESALGVKAVIAGLSAAATGRFWNFDGSSLAW